jgi:hypothetical protein
MSAAVFISHASRDKQVAITLCDALEQRGIGCWISSRDIVSGANFQESIVQAVRAARVMVLVFTSNANNSSEIKKELALASQHGLTVIPVRVEDVLPNDAFSYEFATRQWIDAFGDWERAIGRLTEHIRLTLDGGTAGVVPPPPGRIRPRFRRVSTLLIVLVPLLIVFALLAERRLAEPAPVTPTVIPPGRLGHFSSSDGMSGFVLDRSGARPLIRFDGASETIELTETAASLGDIALRRPDGYVLLRIDPQGTMTLYDERHGDSGVTARRDQDAAPLAAAAAHR